MGKVGEPEGKRRSAVAAEGAMHKCLGMTLPLWGPALIPKNLPRLIFASVSYARRQGHCPCWLKDNGTDN